MTVSELNGKNVQLGNTKVLIENIGTGRITFFIEHQTSRSIGYYIEVSNENNQ